jgi:soluble lytic murein transglycosylase-like protein
MPETVAGWRRQRREAAGAVEGRSRWRELARWGTFETDPQVLSELRRLVASEMARNERSAEVAFPDGLAGELWLLALEREAAVWDPGGFPRGDAAQSAWTAARFRELDVPWMAVRDADGAWRQLGSEMPVRALPVELQRSAYPLPMPDLVREASAAGGVHWSLLAAVAREESRWDPSALSVVGARGLMQLMPGTARAVAAQLGWEPLALDRLFEARTNLLLGAAELGRLERAFEGLRAPAVAAYNAGEAQARLWLEQCGERCTDGRYVAGISFTATRDYTAAVLAAASAYRELYSEDSQAAPAAGENVSD